MIWIIRILALLLIAGLAYLQFCPEAMNVEQLAPHIDTFRAPATNWGVLTAACVVVLLVVHRSD
jgi:fumarate reductase subunit C